MARFRFGDEFPGEAKKAEAPPEPSSPPRRDQDPCPVPAKAAEPKPAPAAKAEAPPPIATPAPRKPSPAAKSEPSPEPTGAPPPVPAAKAPKPAEKASAPKERRQPPWIALGLLVVTAIYCLAELAYNLSLIEFVAAADTSVEEFERLETFGKWLAAIGLALFVSRQFPRWKGALAFAALAPAAYMGISWGFDAAIRALPAQTQTQGYYLGAYRNLVVNGHIEDRVFLPEGSAADPEAKLALANMPLAAFGSADIPGIVSEWVYGGEERSAAMANGLDGLWEAMRLQQSKIEPYWATYALESKKVADKSGALRDLAEKMFLRYAGMPPGLPKEEFLARAVAASPGLAAAREAYVIPANPSVGYPGLQAKSIPAFADREAFDAFILERVAEAEDAGKKAAGNVLGSPEAFRAVSSAFVPPMSMALSLLSLALNAALLVAGAIVLAARPFGAGRKFALGVSIVSLAAVFAMILSAPPAFRDGGMAELRQKAASESAWGFAWAKAMDAEAAVLRVAHPAMPALREAFLAPPQGVQTQRIEIRKAPAVDNLDELEKTLGRMRDASPLDLPQADPSVRVDEGRLQERGYYGEIRTEGENPYLRK